MSRYIISCGGTGGHLSPGISLAEGLIARGHTVTLLISQKKVDARLIEKYPQFGFLRVPGTETLTLHEHSEIVDAVAASDEDRAVAALTAHLTRANPLYARAVRKPRRRAAGG